MNQGNGVLTIDDSIQSNLQNAGAPTSPAVVSALTTTLAGASQFDMRSHRYVGDLRFGYTVSRDVDLKFAVKNTTRNGYNLMSFGFGTSPGLNPAVELGVPTDDRTTDIKGGLEYANDRGMLAVGYTGSWYDNTFPLCGSTTRFG